jgi:hypothetical protein
MDAAAGNVADGADFKPIQDWLDEGYDFELDVLPAVRNVVPKAREPLRTWRASFVQQEIIKTRGQRLAAQPPPDPEKVRRGQLVKALQFHRGAWSDAWGPGPGQPGCNIPEDVLQAAEEQFRCETSAQVSSR